MAETTARIKLEKVVEIIRETVQDLARATIAVCLVGGAGIGLSVLGQQLAAFFPVLAAIERADATPRDEITAYSVAEAASIFGIYVAGAGIGTAIRTTAAFPAPLEESGGELVILGAGILVVSVFAAEFVFHPEKGYIPSAQNGMEADS